MTDIDACDLLRNCLAGRSTGDWHEFIDRHGREVRRTIWRTAARMRLQLASPDLDELVQDFYCRLLSVRDREFGGQTEDELRRYIVRVAQSLVIDRLRQESASKRQPRVRSRVADPSRLRSSKLGPEERLLKKERRQEFFRRCFEVVRCDRVAIELQALAMALLDGWSSREIAGELRGAVSSDRVDRLVWLLRRRMLKDGIRMPRRINRRPPLPVPTT